MIDTKDFDVEMIKLFEDLANDIRTFVANYRKNGSIKNINDPLLNSCLCLISKKIIHTTDIDRRLQIIQSIDSHLKQLVGLMGVKDEY